MLQFFAHPGHDHSKMLAEQKPLDTNTIIILVAAAIFVIGIIIAIVIVNKQQKKAGPN